MIQADLRDARLRLLADDYVTLARNSRVTRPTRQPPRALRAELEAVLVAARLAEAELEAARAAARAAGWPARRRPSSRSPRWRSDCARR